MLGDELNASIPKIRDSILDTELECRRQFYRCLSVLVFFEESWRFEKTNYRWLAIARMQAPIVVSAYTSWIKAKVAVRSAVLDKFQSSPFYNKLFRSSPFGGAIFQKSALDELIDFAQRTGSAMSDILKKPRSAFRMSRGTGKRPHNFNQPNQKRPRTNPQPFRPTAGPSRQSGEFTSNPRNSQGQRGGGGRGNRRGRNKRF